MLNIMIDNKIYIYIISRVYIILNFSRLSFLVIGSVESYNYSEKLMNTEIMIKQLPETFLLPHCLIN